MVKVWEWWRTDRTTPTRTHNPNPNPHCTLTLTLTLNLNLNLNLNLTQGLGMGLSGGGLIELPGCGTSYASASGCGGPDEAYNDVPHLTFPNKVRRI